MIPPRQSSFWETWGHCQLQWPVMQSLIQTLGWRTQDKLQADLGKANKSVKQKRHPLELKGLDNSIWREDFGTTNLYGKKKLRRISATNMSHFLSKRQGMTLVLEWKGRATCVWLDFRITSEYDYHLLSILPFSEQKHLLQWSLPVSRLHVGWMGRSNLSFQRRKWYPTRVLLPGKSHGWRSLEGCSLWGH